jgi:hypothetical protein
MPPDAAGGLAGCLGGGFEDSFVDGLAVCLFVGGCGAFVDGGVAAAVPDALLAGAAAGRATLGGGSAFAIVVGLAVCLGGD